MATKRRQRRVPWNKGKIVGQKAPLKLREIWAIRVRLQLRSNLRDLALFNLAIDSKLRACDLLSLRVGDLAHENHVNSRAVVMQRKKRRPVQFEITELSREALQAWTRAAGLRSSDLVFPSRSGDSPHLSTR
jgi:integrase